MKGFTIPRKPNLLLIIKYKHMPTTILACSVKSDRRNYLIHSYPNSIQNCTSKYNTKHCITSIIYIVCRHERQLHPNFDAETRLEEQQISESDEKKEDFMFNYHQAKMMLGLIIMSFEDAVKEGDGECLFQLYKILLHIINLVSDDEESSATSASPLIQKQRKKHEKKRRLSVSTRARSIILGFWAVL